MIFGSVPLVLSVTMQLFSKVKVIIWEDALTGKVYKTLKDKLKESYILSTLSRMCNIHCVIICTMQSIFSPFCHTEESMVTICSMTIMLNILEFDFTNVRLYCPADCCQIQLSSLLYILFCMGHTNMDTTNITQKFALIQNL